MAGLVREAALRALEDAGLTWKDIDAVVIGKAPDLFEGVMMPESYLADALGASRQADDARAHGRLGRRVHRAGRRLADPGRRARPGARGGLGEAVGVQRDLGASTHLPFSASLVVGAGGYFAPHIREYIRRSGAPEHIGHLVAVKDRQNALKNPYAHLRIQGINQQDGRVDPDALGADPLSGHLPSSDGACAMVLSSEDSDHRQHPRLGSRYGDALRADLSARTGTR